MPTKPKINADKAEAKMVTATLPPNPNGALAEKDLAEVAKGWERVNQRYGGLSHQALRAARQTKGGAVLNKYYPLDPKKAAEKCWQQESYKIIASIMVFIKETPTLPPIRYYHRVVSKKEPPSFKPVTVLFSNNSLMEQRIQEACEELDLWQRKYQTLISYSKWFQKTHAKVTEVVVGVRTKLSQVVDPRDVEEEEGEE